MSNILPMLTAEGLVVDRYFSELLNRGDFTKAEEILWPGFIFYGPSTPAGLDTRAFIHYIEEIRAAFSNKHFRELERIVEGNRVVIRFQMTGIQDGAFCGWPASGASIDVEGCDLIMLRDGKIAEVRAYFDLMSVIQRILIPPPVRAFGELMEHIWRH